MFQDLLMLAALFILRIAVPLLLVAGCPSGGGPQQVGTQPSWRGSASAPIVLAPINPQRVMPTSSSCSGRRRSFRARRGARS